MGGEEIDKDNFGYYDVEPNREYVIRYTLKDEYHNIENYTFPSCQNITSVIIPSSSTSIGDSAFRDCSGLTSVTIPSGVTSIGEWAFLGCSGLLSVTFEEGSQLTTIDYGAFQLCSGLTSVTIPSSATTIGTNAFRGCESLSAVTCLATTPPTLGSWAFNNNASGRKIYVPSGSVNAYKTASGWSAYASDIEPIGGVPLN